MFEIKKFIDEQSDLWEKFVKNANNGTIFHTRKFLAIIRRGDLLTIV